MAEMRQFVYNYAHTSDSDKVWSVNPDPFDSEYHRDIVRALYGIPYSDDNNSNQEFYITNVQIQAEPGTKFELNGNIPIMIGNNSSIIIPEDIKVTSLLLGYSYDYIHVDPKKASSNSIDKLKYASACSTMAYFFDKDYLNLKTNYWKERLGKNIFTGNSDYSDQNNTNQRVPKKIGATNTYNPEYVDTILQNLKFAEQKMKEQLKVYDENNQPLNIETNISIIDAYYKYSQGWYVLEESSMRDPKNVLVLADINYVGTNTGSNLQAEEKEEVNQNG